MTHWNGGFLRHRSWKIADYRFEAAFVNRRRESNTFTPCVKSTDLFTTIFFPSFPPPPSSFLDFFTQDPLRLIISIHPPKKGRVTNEKQARKERGSFALDDLTHFAPHAPFFSCFFYLESRESLVRRSARFLQDCLFLERMRRSWTRGWDRSIYCGYWDFCKISNVDSRLCRNLRHSRSKQTSFFLFFLFRDYNLKVSSNWRKQRVSNISNKINRFEQSNGIDIYTYPEIPIPNNQTKINRRAWYERNSKLSRPQITHRQHILLLYPTYFYHSQI